MQLANGRTDALAQLRSERNVMAADHLHHQAPLAQGGRGFQANKTVADNHRARCRLRCFIDSRCILAAAQYKHVAQYGAGDVQWLRFASGGDQCRVIVEVTTSASSMRLAWASRR